MAQTSPQDQRLADGIRGRKTFSLLVPPSTTEQGCHTQELPREGNDERKVCEMGEIVIFHLAVGCLHSLSLVMHSLPRHALTGIGRKGCRDIPLAYTRTPRQGCGCYWSCFAAALVGVRVFRT